MNPAEHYILKQDEPYKSIMLHIAATVETVIPDCNMLYKWRMPFFYVGKRPICYLRQSRDYVDLGFWNAQHITVCQEHFTVAKRKKMKSLRYKTLASMDHEVLETVLKTAYAV